MAHLVLGIHYPLNEQTSTRQEWASYGLDFHFVDTLHDGVEKLLEHEYVCVVIYSDYVHQNYIDTLRSVKSTPVVIISPKCTSAQRIHTIRFGAMRYAMTSEVEQSSAQDSLRYCLDNYQSERPLTIITVGDLYFCLEYRAVEVCGQQIDLTEKEFEILALLIINPKQVFTHEMIMDQVWKADIAFYSVKAISVHISNLRRKLKVTPDAPDYIQSIRGVGYRFRVPNTSL